MISVPVFVLNISRYYGPMKPSYAFLVKKKKGYLSFLPFNNKPVVKVISFGNKSTKEKLETRIWNPATFGLWNPESKDVESGIHGHGIRNPQPGIQNPRLSWITLHGHAA